MGWCVAPRNIIVPYELNDKLGADPCPPRPASPAQSDAERDASSITRASSRGAGCIEHVPPDPGAAKIWLTNRRPEEWRDRSTTELTGKNGAPIIPVLNVTISRVKPFRTSARPWPPIPVRVQRMSACDRGKDQKNELDHCARLRLVGYLKFTPVDVFPHTTDRRS